ncbi:cadherin repeat domain-containing protein [Pseudoteredinibacter isoporae]|uniref:Cadherin domain-containing protein n=1 Tax=Pseudoteredinibacter isoporae TaxID=570281 RepID=A0A7X0JUD8_9GAMM|nr:cadherin repeat domain-containing protein [Pseudoteredinibacter isoporae]MBB6521888.1 hypothetical protein [Pseudoteredinibacter isoporae]NHO87432.1 cadherin repeat domain-containing protein [Pseudoteredinibacter isoporae]NIB24237.1 cadherin repeat domain-containing protein [Pseudoteredinibacter isoporae]
MTDNVSQTNKNALVNPELISGGNKPATPSVPTFEIKENDAGAKVVQLGVTDPDKGDTHSYTVSDDRFEVVGSVLKLKDGASLNYELDAELPLTVTVTDAGGLSSSLNVKVVVLDIAETVSSIENQILTMVPVPEDSAIGSEVGVKVNAVDPDAGDQVSYELVDDADGLFTIDPTTGLVTLAGELDYETAEHHEITVRATSSDGSSSEASYIIPVGDVEEIVPVSDISDSNAEDNSVVENSVVGTVVGVTALAVGDPNDTISYSLSEDADGRFSINGTTGVVTVAGELDYETASSYEIVVVAISSNGTRSEASFTVNIADENDAPTLLVNGRSQQGSTNTITEDFESGTTGWSNNNTTDGGASLSNFLGRFSGGGIFGGGPDAVEKTFALGSGAESAVIEFDLYEIDSWDNENFIIDVNGERIEIPLSYTRDDEANSGTQGSVSWSLVPQGPASNLGFTNAWYIQGTDQIHTVRIEVQQPSDQLTLKLSSSLDEWVENESWGIDNLRIQSFDSHGGSNSLAVQENQAGAHIATVAVQDQDGQGQETYSVSDSRFEVVGGVLKLKDGQSLDYETESSVTLTVTVTDEGGLTDQQTLTIGVIDVNELVPVGSVSDSDSRDNTVAENSTVGSVVGVTALAVAGPNDTVTYSLSEDADGRFTIDGDTGVVTVAGELDYETASSHNIVVVATSSNGTRSEASFTVNIADANDAPTLLVNGSDQVGATTLITEDFENDASGWSNNTTTDGGVHFGNFLGRFGQGAGNIWTGKINDVVEKTFSLGSGAESAVVEFNLYEIDSWDGENFIVEVNGERIEIPLSIYRDSEDNSGSQGNISWSLVTHGPSAHLGFTNGWSQYNDGDQIHTVRIEIQQPGDELNLKLSSTLDEAVSNESWGIDNLRIQSFDGNGANHSLAVQENQAGAHIATVAVQDPDGQGQESYRVDDARFEVVGGVLKLKDGQSLDYEAETSVTLTVTVTDEGGLTDQQTLTIAVIDVNEQVPVVPVGSISDSDGNDDIVAENSAVGSVVGVTALAVGGPNDTVSYSLSEDADGRFAIDSDTGVVTVAGDLDYEAASSHNIVVVATSSNGTQSEASFTINIGNANEAPTLLINGSDQQTSTAITTITEDFENGATGWSNNTTSDGGSPTGTVLGRFGGPNIFTGNAPDSTEKTFALGSGADRAVIEFNLYEFDSWDGESFVVEVNGERVEIASLSHQRDDGATSGTQGSLSWSMEPQGASADHGFTQYANGYVTDQLYTVRIEVEQPGDQLTLRLGSTLNEWLENESWAIDNLKIESFDGNGASNTLAVQENQAGAQIATVAVQDPDGQGQETYSVDDARFEVVGGVLKLKDDQSLDYETETSVTLTVTVTDEGGLTDQQTLTVDVIDVNELLPVPVGHVTDRDGGDNTVAENSPVGTVVGVTAQAAGGPNDTVTYSLSDNADGRFAIDASSGVVTVAGDLDYEAQTSHVITVVATSSNGTQSESSFTIQVSDVQELVPVASATDADASTNSVAENSPVGTVVGITAQAVSGPNDTVTYTLGDNAGGRFAIDPNTGVVTVAGDLDYESNNSHQIVVVATSSNGTQSEASFSIEVSDVQELIPLGSVSDSDISNNTVDENSSVGTVVGVTALAVGGPNDIVSYSLLDDAGGRFAIDPESGVVTVAGDLDYESHISHQIVVLATSSNGTQSEATFTVSVADVVELVPLGSTTDRDPRENSVAENSAVGTVVGLIASATGDPADQVSYSLSDDADGRFQIDANTGEVSVAGGLDYESATEHSITVVSTSSNGTSSEASFTIQVTNVNEAPIIDLGVLADFAISRSASIPSSMSDVAKALNVQVNDHLVLADETPLMLATDFSDQATLPLDDVLGGSESDLFEQEEVEVKEEMMAASLEEGSRAQVSGGPQLDAASLELMTFDPLAQFESVDAF